MKLLLHLSLYYVKRISPFILGKCNWCFPVLHRSGACAIKRSKWNSFPFSMDRASPSLFNLPGCSIACFCLVPETSRSPKGQLRMCRAKKAQFSAINPLPGFDDRHLCFGPDFPIICACVLSCAKINNEFSLTPNRQNKTGGVLCKRHGVRRL